MDTQVLAAMARWPDVPAVYGWLSLTESGHWRLHPAGTALQQPESPGEAITSPQILAFIDRNYSADPQGQWYFQNGPQRVYVRLDAAPYILHTTTDAASGRLKLRTHTGLDIRELRALYVDETGRLYMATDRGPALMAGRDLPAVLDALGPDAVAACLETGRHTLTHSSLIQGFPASPVPLEPRTRAALETLLGFRRLPEAPPGAAHAGPPAGGPAPH